MNGGPIAIGGTGGSGTRAVAKIVRHAGRFMGAVLNPYEDTIPIGRFDWRNGPAFLRGDADDGAMDAAFEAALAEHLGDHDPQRAWGWKHPHSYLLLGFYARRFPDLRYVHVIRDGRDMALSDNQRQLGHYGAIALGREPDAGDAVDAICFWAWANLRAADDGQALLGDRYLRVRLEDLVADPLEWTARILELAGGGDAAAAAAEVERPPTLGRWRALDAATLAALEAAAAPALDRFGYREVR